MKIKLDAETLALFENFPLGITELERKGFAGLFLNNRYLNHLSDDKGGHTFIWQNAKEYHSFDGGANPFSIFIESKRVHLIANHNKFFASAAYVDGRDSEDSVALGVVVKLVELIKEHNAVKEHGRFH